MTANDRSRAIGLAILAILLYGAFSYALAGRPGEISGTAWALDGDTVMVETGDGTKKIRLWGIDAPEIRSPDGWRARAALDKILRNAGAAVTCRTIDKDKYERFVAICRSEAGKTDIGLAMIEAGWAIEYRIYSRRLDRSVWAFYEVAEMAAQSTRRGRWRRPALDWSGLN